MPSINAHFDGQAFVPDEPLTISIPLGKVVQVTWEAIGSTKPDPTPLDLAVKPGRFADLAKLARHLPGAPPTLSMDHDHPYSGD